MLWRAEEKGSCGALLREADEHLHPIMPKAGVLGNPHALPPRGS